MSYVSVIYYQFMAYVMYLIWVNPKLWNCFLDHKVPPRVPSFILPNNQ